MDYKEFREILRNSGLTRHGRDEIQKPIDYTLEEYIRTGKTKTWLRGMPEIIVDGKIEWVTRGAHRYVEPERIAVSSIAHVLDYDRASKSVAPRQFLAQFA